MNKSLLLMTALVMTPAAHALDAACEPYVAAVAKSTQQPARHGVSELGSDMRTEAIMVNGKFYANIGGKWRDMKVDLFAVERKMLAEIRSGKIALSECKNAGSETVDGVRLSVLSYTITLPGLPPTPSKAYIGSDGLLYAQSGDGVKVRYRYTGVTAPAL